MSQIIETLNQILIDATNRGLVHNFTTDEELSDSQITIHDKKLTNFGSCSYLGLENHPDLIKGAEDALNRYGTQFSTSRTYLSLGLYNELEEELGGIFNKPLIVTASTTLGHLATLPVIVEDGDAVILDLQVHASVQLTTQILKARKIHITIIPHNSIEVLETKIRSLQNKHKKIWYLADGIYSMYGDTAPLQALERLLDTYKQFHLYIDDAHGMGWTGANGAGYVRSQIKHHEKMVLATSLNKSFASAGGLIVFPNEQLKNKVKNCGSTLIFSGPIQPPMLGSALAASKLQKTEAFKILQQDLRKKILYVNQCLNDLSLPQYCQSETPLFFIPVGLPRITYGIVNRMKNKGYYLNTAAFPAVPMKKSGIRFMINAKISFEEIEQMLVTLQREYVLGLLEEGSNISEVADLFKIAPFHINLKSEKPVSPNVDDEFNELHYNSIKSIKKDEWDQFIGHSGCHSYKNIENLESSFSNHKEKESNASFYYSKITDQRNEVVVFAFYSCFWVKDDMLSTAEVSAQVEEVRKSNPDYLTSKQIITGTLFSVGKSIYINKDHESWEIALGKLIDQMQKTGAKENATKIMLKDINPEEHIHLKDIMLELGLIEYKLPNNCSLERLNWNSHEEYLKTLGQKYRYSLRKEILNYTNQFDVKFDKPNSEKEKRKYFELYKNVFNNALELNVFELPYAVFTMMFNDPNYDIITLYLKNDKETPVATLFSYKNNTTYNALVVGLDYKYVRSHNSYKQILYQSVIRAKSLNCEKIDLAFTAELEKKKVGAKVNKAYAFVQATEHLSNARLSTFN